LEAPKPFDRRVENPFAPNLARYRAPSSDPAHTNDVSQWLNMQIGVGTPRRFTQSRRRAAAGGRPAAQDGDEVGRDRRADPARIGEVRWQRSRSKFRTTRPKRWRRCADVKCIDHAGMWEVSSSDDAVKPLERGLCTLQKTLAATGSGNTHVRLVVHRRRLAFRKGRVRGPPRDDVRGG
jgi:hypothetical protein